MGVESFLEWIWARHHNPWSWYIRPLFILPFCYFAWRRRPVWLLLTLVVLLSSLAWFPAPEPPRPDIAAYLALERRWMANGPVAAFILVAVIAFLWLLAAAFWTRNWLLGLVVLNAATLAKVAFGIALGGEKAGASLAPALATLAICDAVVLAIASTARRRGGRRERRGGSPQCRGESGG